MKEVLLRDSYHLAPMIIRGDAAQHAYAKGEACLFQIPYAVEHMSRYGEMQAGGCR